MAHFQLRGQREFATCQRSTTLIPIMKECESASHLPAADIDNNDGDILSHASYEKRQHGSNARQHGLWAQWMEHLKETGQSWPSDEYWDKLRCESLTDIGNCSEWDGYIGLVYADGNGMGKIIKTLDLPETYRQFSKIVDESIREACFTALNQVSESETKSVRNALKNQKPFKALPADILLLGGDDLLVVLPADRSLDFAQKATETFQHLTQKKIDALEDEKTRGFFYKQLGNEGFTISCGVAIAKSNYPFYLLLDLAEELLKNAKRKDSLYSHSEADGDARIDFHVVAGANSYALAQVREETYLAKTGASAPRTLRPLSCRQLEQLRENIQELRAAGFPHSKLHALQAAALLPNWIKTSMHIQEIFARCQHGQDRSQRRALWESIDSMCPKGYSFEFPWFKRDDQRLLCVSDLVDAYRLFSK